MLNINEASVDLLGKHADLKILLKTFFFLVAQKFNATNNKFLNFAFECYPEPMSSNNLSAQTPYESVPVSLSMISRGLRTRAPLPVVTRRDSGQWCPMTRLRDHTQWTHHSL